MKILLPYYTRSDIKIDDKLVIGGLEKFAQLVYQNFSEVIPVHFTDNDRKKRLVTSKIVAAAKSNNVDIIISNYENDTLTINPQKELDIPILWISHSCAGGIGRISQVKTMVDFIDNGGTVYMMSENQYNGMNKLSKRVNDGKPLILNGGYINSAFCNGDEKVADIIEQDAVTIGRMNREKNPFWIHKKLEGSGKHSLVLTSYIKEFMNKDQEEYYEENKNWKYPQETLVGLQHTQVLDKMSKSGCYVSTHPRESWGITALEALSYGLPTVLLTDSTGIHSSECIPASNEHIFKISTGTKKSDFVNLVDKLNKIGYSERVDISEKTKEKHSRESWKKSISNAIDKTIEIYNSKSKVKTTTQRTLLDFEEEE